MYSATINLELHAHYPAVLFHFCSHVKKIKYKCNYFPPGNKCQQFHIQKATCIMLDDQSNNFVKITGKRLTLKLDYHHSKKILAQ